jgi:hypothetical protein
VIGITKWTERQVSLRVILSRSSLVSRATSSRPTRRKMPEAGRIFQLVEQRQAVPPVRLRVLRTRRQRPRSRRAAQERDEVAAPHLRRLTSSIDPSSPAKAAVVRDRQRQLALQEPR